MFFFGYVNLNLIVSQCLMLGGKTHFAVQRFLVAQGVLSWSKKNKTVSVGEYVVSLAKLYYIPKISRFLTKPFLSKFPNCLLLLLNHCLLIQSVVIYHPKSTAKNNLNINPTVTSHENLPRRSMVLEYVPTFTPQITQRWIFHGASGL